MAKEFFRIGFANLLAEQSFAQTVQQGLEAAALTYPHIELTVRFNELNNKRAFANIKEFIAMPVDLAIVFHIDERFNAELGAALMRKGIPTIALEIPVPYSTYFGADNRKAGELAGIALEQWIRANWNGRVDKVLVVTDSRVLERQQWRLNFAVKHLVDTLGFDPGNTLYLDSESNTQVTQQRAQTILENWAAHRHIVIVGINDETTLAALEVARQMGREEQVVAIGHGASKVEEEFQNPSSRFIGSIAYFPEHYGTYVLPLALQILNKERVSREHYMDHVCITRANVGILKG